MHPNRKGVAKRKRCIKKPFLLSLTSFVNDLFIISVLIFHDKIENTKKHLGHDLTDGRFGLTDGRFGLIA